MAYGMEMQLQHNLDCIVIAAQDSAAVVAKVAPVAETPFSFFFGAALTQCFIITAAHISVFAPDWRLQP